MSDRPGGPQIHLSAIVPSWARDRKAYMIAENTDIVAWKSFLNSLKAADLIYHP